LEPGIWEGEGQVFFPFASVELSFKIRWTISYRNKRFECQQEVEMVETQEKVISQLHFIPLTEENLSVTLFHPEAKEVQGNAQSGENSLAWTFEALEGKEEYKFSEEGICHFHSTYGYEGIYRREIRGKLRKLKSDNL
jgi:hypothetical protein